MHIFALQAVDFAQLAIYWWSKAQLNVLALAPQKLTSTTWLKGLSH